MTEKLIDDKQPTPIRQSRMPFSLPLFIEPVHFAQVGSGGADYPAPIAVAAGRSC